MKWIGRFLQLVGLIMLPLSMMLELSSTLGRDFYVSDMVIMLVFGIGVFYVGRLMEGLAGGSPSP
jgi:hypothetical protein